MNKKNKCFFVLLCIVVVFICAWLGYNKALQDKTSFRDIELADWQNQALDYYEHIKNYRPNSTSTELDKYGDLLIHLFDNEKDNTVALETYIVDKDTGIITKKAREEIDFNDIEKVEIPFELKRESIYGGGISSNFLVDFGIHLENARKVIRYSLEAQFEKGKIDKVYFGYIYGTDSLNNRQIINFIEYNDEIVYIEGSLKRLIGDDIREIVWEEALCLLNLDNNDDYIELALNWESATAGMGDYLDIFRIVNGKFVEIGSTYGSKLYKDGNKILDDYSYLKFIEEPVLVSYYQVIDNKLEHIYKFEDGRNSLTTENQEADFSELSKNEYTVQMPLMILGSCHEGEDGLPDYDHLNKGEKVHILEITGIYFEDLKILRENGDIVYVTETTAGRS